MKNKLNKILPVIALVLVLFSQPIAEVFAATTADVTVQATPKYVAIADNVTTMDFGPVDESATVQRSTAEVGITNTSSTQTDQTISVTTTTWAGGVTWTHSDTATPGADTVGLKANKGGTWGVSDVIVKNAAPNDIATNQAATTDYTYGLELLTGTFTDGVQKSITVRVSAAAG